MNAVVVLEVPRERLSPATDYSVLLQEGKLGPRPTIIRDLETQAIILVLPETKVGIQSLVTEVIARASTAPIHADIVSKSGAVEVIARAAAIPELTVDTLGIQGPRGFMPDSIRITDGTDALKVNPDGSINAVLAPSPGQVNFYNEISAVASGSETTILSHTVPVGKTLYLKRVSVSGTNIGDYAVKFSSTVSARRRTSWFDFNTDFVFSEDTLGYPLDAGTIVTVTVLHSSSGPGMFNARIEGAEQ